MKSIQYLYSIIVILFFIRPLFSSPNGLNVFICYKNKLSVVPESKYFRDNDKTTNLQSLSFNKSLTFANAVQLGIQETINQSKYDTKEKVQKFFERNSKLFDVQHSINGLIFKSMAPLSFVNLRILFNTSDIFNESFQSSTLIEGKLSEKGKVPRYFYTNDYKFNVETISVEKFNFFSSMLSEYFSHFCKFPKSLLPKVLGLYYIKYQNKEYYMMIAINHFPFKLQKPLHKIYYIKGNEKEALLKDSKGNPVYCSLDNNFLKDYNKGLIIPSTIHNNLQKVLENDCEFLEKFKIVNYQLVLIITPFDNTSETQSKTKGYKTQTSLIQDSGKLQLIGKNNNKLLLADIEIINIFQENKISKATDHMLNCIPCKLKHGKILQDPKSYGKQFIKFITSDVFVSDGAK